MRRKHTSKLRGVKEINIAPLIDIIFILVIFFMVTSTLIVHSGMKVKLPQAKNSKTVKQLKLVVYVDKDNKIFLNEEEVHKIKLKILIKEHIAKGGEPQISVKADKQVDYGEIIKVIDIAKDGGIEDISFAIEKKDSIDYE